MYFEELDRSSPHHDKILVETMNKHIAPLYGDQESSIKKILNATDRKCLLMNDEQTPVGLLVFKTSPSNEYANFKIINSLEIKTFVLINPEQQSRKGYGKNMLEKLLQLASQDDKVESIHVCVSEQRIDSLNFFKKNNFEPVAKLWSKFRKNEDEILLQRRIKENRL